MVNYYDILKVSPKASNAEIKSAYRRLARKLHPDKNNGSSETSREFAKVAKAYEVLGNPHARADYDRLMLQAQFKSSSNTDSVFSSENPHARRWRQMVYERRYNEIIDRMIADERRESMALQKVIFPVVALFVSTFAVAIFKPTFFTNSAIVGKIVLLSLFVAGVIHLVGRLREAFDRYTYDQTIHDSILEDNVPEAKPYSRFTAISFIVLGFVASLGVGLLIGNYFELFISAAMPAAYSKTFQPEFLFYPPIVVLLVDVVHSVATRYDY